MTPDSGRRPYIAGNWKMFKTSADARSYVKELRKVLPAEPAADVGICVPFTALAATMKAAEGSDNVLYPMKEALRAKATVGEVCNALRDVWGVYVPPDAF